MLLNIINLNAIFNCIIIIYAYVNRKGILRENIVVVLFVLNWAIHFHLLNTKTSSIFKLLKHEYSKKLLLSMSC